MDYTLYNLLKVFNKTLDSDKNIFNMTIPSIQSIPAQIFVKEERKVPVNVYTSAKDNNKNSTNASAKDDGKNSTDASVKDNNKNSTDASVKDDGKNSTDANADASVKDDGNDKVIISLNPKYQTHIIETPYYVCNFRIALDPTYWKDYMENASQINLFFL